MTKQRFDRIDEKFVRVDERLDEVNRRIREGREDTIRCFGEVERRFDRVEGDIVEVKKGVTGVQATLNRLILGLVVAFASVLLTKGL